MALIACTRPASPAARPGGSASPSSAAAVLACRLPIARSDFGSAATPGGFVTFPGGRFAPDAGSAVAPIPTSAAPQGERFGLSYDSVMGRWLPVPPEWIALDGRAYVYPAPEGIHMVKIATGLDTVLVSNQLGPPQSRLWPIQGDRDALYLSAWDPGRVGPVDPRGLWMVSLGGGAPTRITDSGVWPFVGGGAAWGTDTPTTGKAAGYGRRLVRLDLTTASRQAWYELNAMDMVVMGLDLSGHPVVSTIGGAVESRRTWLVSSPGSALELEPAILTRLIADRNGLWFGGGRDPQDFGSLYRYTPGVGVERVARVDFPGGVGLLIAGGCLR